VPSIAHILETALYVDDIDRAKAFYRDTLGLHVMSEGPRLVTLDAGKSTVLLLFKRGATSEGLRFPGGWIPPHDASGPAHLAFAIHAAELDTWERQLEAHGVTIESRVTWSGGGRSVYFRDPDGHSVEMATPGVWPTY
jgi:catechol 2,3-dioxygenase-like lactoylglutathione lyase family enzyme